MSEYLPGAMRAASRIFSKMHTYAGLECWIVPDMAYEIDKEFGDLLAACVELSLYAHEGECTIPRYAMKRFEAAVANAKAEG